MCPPSCITPTTTDVDTATAYPRPLPTMDDETRAASSLDSDRDENNLNTDNDNDDDLGAPNKRHTLTTTLPDDLPKSLDDRRSVPVFPQETEIYDAWMGMYPFNSIFVTWWYANQRVLIGQSQFLTTPVAAKPLTFNLALDDHSHDDEHDIQAQYGRGMIDVDKDVENTARLEDSDARLMEMLAAQAAHREVDSLGADEDSIADDEKLKESEKKDILQRGLNMAASNGDVERVRKLLNGKARGFVDVNMPDEEGTVPLIYASCFVCPPFIEWLLVYLANCNRDTKMLFRSFWAPARMSTSRIATSGAR